MTNSQPATSTPVPIRRPGAPLGNQNARKPKLYEPHPDIAGAFIAAHNTRGCAEEIALLRMRIKAMAYRAVSNKEFFQALEILNRLLITHYRLMHPDGDPVYTRDDLPAMSGPEMRRPPEPEPAPEPAPRDNP